MEQRVQKITGLFVFFQENETTTLRIQNLNLESNLIFILKSGQNDSFITRHCVNIKPNLQTCG